MRMGKSYGKSYGYFMVIRTPLPDSSKHTSKVSRCKPQAARKPGRQLTTPRLAVMPSGRRRVCVTCTVPAAKCTPSPLAQAITGAIAVPLALVRSLVASARLCGAVVDH